jgi:DNA gyrase/topoisomerase IV subunit B
MTKTIEETYKKLSQREHVLHRPNMYIGEVKRTLEEMWIMDNSSKNSSKMSKRMAEYSPGFLKVFDEVLTNALDHSTRDTTVSMIKVEYSKETGEISVWNNGSGVPVVVHKEHNMYVPELIFGHLLAGSNYDDTQQRIGAGVNGLGVKLCNIFSKRFVVETLDSNTGLKFVQEYSENMTQRGSAKVTKASSKSYTKITFVPDYARFGMKGLEDDTTFLINKRVYDCIACTDRSVSIFLNGEKLQGKGLQDYSNYFFEKDKIKCYHDSFTQRVGKNEMVWEYIVIPSDHFEQVSFVNGNSTYQGGKHVDHVIYQITSKLKTLLETKKKLKDVKPAIIKERMFLFLRSTVVNPQFSSQTKEQLTTQVKDFGCKVEVSDKFIDKLWKSPIVEDIVEFCKMKETMDLAKTTDGKKKNKIYVPKLEDALWAGTAKSDQCTLILTEGLSAMTFALWGRSIVGPERFGVFPLKGKCNSEDTKIPLWNGEIRLAKDIQIGDNLIGDDGNKRTVLTLHKGNGKMYEVSQDRGESYKVNDEHILTLCMLEHKKIYWVPSNYTWRALYWDKKTKNIKAKEIKANIKIGCKECKIMVNTKCLKRHYTRKHKDVKYVPYKLQNKDIDDQEVIRSRQCLQEFLSTIDDNNIIDICIQDYLNVTESFKRKLKGIRGECVNWEHQEVLLEPYILGLWLGDGMKSGYAYSCDEENDQEIMNYLNEWGKNNDASFKQSSYNKYTHYISSIDNFRNKGQAPLKKILSKYNLVNDKHIPREYLINSKEIRLRLLAGIIDTDGYVCNDGTIEISQSTKHKRLVDDIVYLSRSLGFYTYVSDKITNYNYKESGEKAKAYRIKISGDTIIIPTLLPRKQSTSTTQYNMRNSTGTIQIKEIPHENYVGIGIDGNSRFVINDFTITHNCLNVRDATVSQLMNNEEINNLKQIIGLKQGVEYKDTKDLRYGKIMCLTDADTDGSHIKGLLVNLFHCWWPSLVKLNFIETLRTPIVKAIRGQKVLEFYTEQDYKRWQSTTNTRGYQIRYFKGLGTSKKEDAQETFRRIDRLRINYYYKDNLCDDAITLAFEKDKNVKRTVTEKTSEDEGDDKGTNDDKNDDNNTSTDNIKCSDRRKRWLAKYDKNVYIDVKENRVSYQDLIHKELIHFSIYDNMRSIPSLCDGLKPSQRKILYYMLKNNINKAIKVAQLSGYVSAETGYHHGEASLQGAIVNMAQTFVGSNNVNLLFPDGNFGSRLLGGKDAASPRYIFTRLCDIASKIFDKSDSSLLTYLTDDGMEIEPEWFMPILPMVLVNGCEGIGTGYSTYVPPYNPKDIIANLLRVIDDKEPLQMTPYFRGFHGELVETEPGSYMTMGKWERLSDTQIKITELPVGSWVTTYKEFLESFVEGSSNTTSKTSSKTNSKTTKKSTKKRLQLKDVKNKTRDENDDICFIVEFCNSKDLDGLIETKTLEKTLRLTRNFTTNNMYLFSEDLILSKYNSANDILLDFYDLRLEFYEKRKVYLVKRLQNELLLLNAKIRFIDEYINGVLDINRKNKDYIVSLLEERGYPKLRSEINKDTTENNLKDKESDKDTTNTTFDYLIRMPIVSLSLEKITELTTQRDNKQRELEILQSKTEKDLWRDDLEKIIELV